jgi:hypothetical protein
VSHYDVLGVDEHASADEIRRAYVALAREHHPDHRAATGAVIGEADSDATIRAANAAWEVLSDPARRRAYDEQLALGVEVPRGPRIRHLDDTFVPFDATDDEDDAWRYEPDVGDPRTAPSRGLVLAPIVLLGMALLTLLTWRLLDAEVFLFIAVALGALSLLTFILVPLMAMARAAKFENE